MGNKRRQRRNGGDERRGRRRERSRTVPIVAADKANLREHSSSVNAMNMESSAIFFFFFWTHGTLVTCWSKLEQLLCCENLSFTA